MKKKYQISAESKKLMSEILAGNLEYPKRVLTIMLAKGCFPNIRAKGEQTMNMWKEDVAQEISIIVSIHQSTIWAVRAYIGTIIFRMSSKEDIRLSRINFFSELEEKGGTNGQFFQ